MVRKTNSFWVTLGLTVAALEASEPVLDFGRDIRPILSDHCFTCHGPDKESRKAGLRLDTREGAFADLGGYRGFVPGEPDQSEVILRITAADETDRMPPPKSGKPLAPEQIENLRRWVRDGARWGEHWAFVAPVTPPVPEVERTGWSRNPIDRFVLARLESENLKPSREADRATLIRRLTLDLTGLPPTPAEIDVYLADTSVDAYENLVDRLLSSPRYGEHAARIWLDAARYGDTHGLHIDNERAIWPYRDWVIRAFDSNLPFDQFTIEQLAGDLLPNATRDQRVATGFNRCNVTTSEGGAIPQEFAVRYAVDRVGTMATVWMGLTAGCAACHDHKYDPLSQKEFYQLFAFFNSFDENPMDGNALLHPPVIALSTPAQEARLTELDREIELVDKVLRAAVLVVDYNEPAPSPNPGAAERTEFVWIEDALPEGAKASSGDEAWTFVTSKQGPVFSGAKSSVRKADEVGQHYFTEASDRLRVGQGDLFFTYVYLDPDDPPREIMLQFNTTGWKHRAFWGDDLIEFGRKDSPERRRVGPLPERGTWVRLEVKAAQVGLQPGTEIHGWAFTQHGGKVYWDRAGIVSALLQGGKGFDSLLAWEAFAREAKPSGVPDPVTKMLAIPPDKRNAAQRRQLEEYFIEYVCVGTRSVFDPLHAKVDELKQARAAFDRTITRSLVTRELEKPRDTHILIRGEYDNKGDKVTPDVPAALPPFPPNQPPNRLGLARWLLDPEHPLTARVKVNRLWQQHFGFGLVRTAENFGSQGDPPSHPLLLDWLATEFVTGGWDLKALHRAIVTSSTYRQDSRLTPELAERDPDNRLLARGPRFRLDAEVIRDSALAAANLLVEEIGGRGVRPYQPDGIWEAVSYPTSTTANYKRDDGNALYRRSLYTFWKRTAPPPSMTVFDAPNRESCRVRRERTNTPLQALALLNDVQYLEAARHMAERIVAEGGDTLDDQLAYGFRLATARFPESKERQILRELFAGQKAAYQADPDAANRLVHLGSSSPTGSLDPEDLAAWTMVANTLLNLSETITLN